MYHIYYPVHVCEVAIFYTYKNKTLLIFFMFSFLLFYINDTYLGSVRQHNILHNKRW